MATYVAGHCAGSYIVDVGEDDRPSLCAMPKWEDKVDTLSPTAKKVAEQFLKEWTEDKFLQGFSAVDAEGHEVYAADEDAVRWCASGYLTRLTVSGDISIEGSIYGEMCRVFRSTAGWSLIGVNDNRGWKAVVDVFKKMLDNSSTEQAQ